MLIFTLIPISILWTKYYSPLKKNIKIVLTVMIIAIIYQLIADPFAEAWHAWFFSENKVMGLWLFNFPVENIIFFALVSIAISSAVIAFIYHEQKNKN
ncbi:hypothetical protein HY214_02350 [Candidatus Roizmanbacteria bacterium]|nr:hypothetical protein [Candidatus Roizmanbacteria bacterium]